MCRGLGDELKGHGVQELSMPVVALRKHNSHFLPSSAEEKLQVYNLRSQRRARIEVPQLCPTESLWNC